MSTPGTAHSRITSSLARDSLFANTFMSELQVCICTYKIQDINTQDTSVYLYV